MPDNIAIKVEGVSKDFKITHEKGATLKSHFVNLLKGKKNRTVETQHALKDISFEVKQGEFFGIVGRNGSGKSTLLKMLAGIYQPTKGKIQVNGKLVPFIELGVGFNPELTGRENVFLNGALLGFSEEEVAGFYDEVVDFAELEQFMDKKLKNYSSGMQVRLAFAMAIRAQADILLIDEVLAVGDADFQRKCFEYFKHLKKENKTIIFVTHDMNAVKEYCDRGILIDNSRIIKVGTSEEIADAYLMLFNEQTNSNVVITEEQLRWGNQEIHINSIASNVTKQSVSISMDIVSKIDYKRLVIALDIKDADNKLVAGTNTTQINKKGVNFLHGEAKNITLSLDNVFGGGKYIIDVALKSTNMLTIFDSWKNATSFSVTHKSNYFPIIVPATMSENMDTKTNKSK